MHKGNALMLMWINYVVLKLYRVKCFPNCSSINLNSNISSSFLFRRAERQVKYDEIRKKYGKKASYCYKSAHA